MDTLKDIDFDVACLPCNGTGKFWNDTCNECGGTGRRKAYIHEDYLKVTDHYRGAANIVGLVELPPEGGHIEESEEANVVNVFEDYQSHELYQVAGPDVCHMGNVSRRMDSVVAIVKVY